MRAAGVWQVSTRSGCGALVAYFPTDAAARYWADSWQDGINGRRPDGSLMFAYVVGPVVVTEPAPGPVLMAGGS